MSGKSKKYRPFGGDVIGALPLPGQHLPLEGKPRKRQVLQIPPEARHRKLLKAGEAQRCQVRKLHNWWLARSGWRVFLLKEVTGNKRSDRFLGSPT